MVFKTNIRVLAVAVLLLPACSNPMLNTDVLTLSINEKNCMAFEDFFDRESLSFFQFEQTDSVTLSGELLVKPADSLYFVYDYVTIQLYSFDSQGKCKYLIGSGGAGPEEYPGIIQFCIDKRTHTLDVLTNQGHTIKTFDFKGNFLGATDLPKPTSDFIKVNDGTYWIFTGFWDESKYRVHLCDPSGIIKSVLPNPSPSISEFTERKFFGTNTQGLFRESFFPSIYEYDTSSFREAYYIDFGRHAIPDHEYAKYLEPEALMDRMAEGVYSTVQAAQSNEWLFVKTVFQSAEEVSIADFVVSRHDTTITKLTHISLSRELSQDLSLVHIDENQSFYFLTSAQHLINYIKQIQPENSQIHNIDRNGNAVILIVKPKKKLVLG